MSDFKPCSKHIRAIQSFIDAQQERIAKLKADKINGLEILAIWPRFEDGEPVRFGDEYVSCLGGFSKVRSVTLHDDGSFNLHGRSAFFDSFGMGERVKRPERKDFPQEAPKEGLSEKKTPSLSDNWERLEQEVSSDAKVYTSTFVRGLLRRAKALSDSGAHKPGEVV